LDDDDWWSPGKLAAQFAAMTADGTEMSCTGAVEDHVLVGRAVANPVEDHVPVEPDAGDADGPGESSRRSPPPPSSSFPVAATMPRCLTSLPSVLTSENLAATNPIVASSVVVLRDLVDRAGGFRDQAYAQDFDLWRRILALQQHTTTPTALPTTRSMAPSASQPLRTPTTPPPPTTTAAAAAATTAMASLDPPAMVGCSLVREAMVSYGTGSNRSSTRKEARQAVRAIVASAMGASAADLAETALSEREAIDGSDHCQRRESRKEGNGSTCGAVRPSNSVPSIPGSTEGLIGSFLGV
jgi:hypothetical protein